IHPVPHHAVLIIDWYPEMPGDLGPYPLTRHAELLWPDLREGHDEMIGTHVGLAALQRSYPGVAVAVVGEIDFQRRCPALYKGRQQRYAGPGSIGGDVTMQNRRMRGVDTAFQGLQPVALLPHL